MVSAINSALSGLSAAGKRLEVAANNIANQNSTFTNVDGAVTNTPYRAKEVVQTSQANGGVKAEVKDVEGDFQKVYAPQDVAADDNGFVSLPNVDLAEQVVQSQIASYDYKANLKTIKTQDKMFDNLLDIIT